MSALNFDPIRKELTNLVKELRRSWLAHDFPVELYHYTDAGGLLGILTSKSFWSTDINFLNDATELKYASDLINNLLDIKIKDCADGIVGRFWDDSKSFLRFHPGIMNGYVTCFCEKGNLLSQWRAYGAGGAGYSIGVLTESLKVVEEDEPGSPIFKLRLRKIIYDKEVQEHLVTQTINRFFDLLVQVLREAEGEHESSIINLFANDLAAELSEYLYCFKSPAFEEEQEWREILTISNYDFNNDGKTSLKFRASGGSIIPYIELPFATPPPRPFVVAGYPISSITFGPSLHPELTERALYLLVDSTLGRNGVRVIPSDIPLRRT